MLTKEQILPVLDGAIERLSKKGGWTQFTWARDATGLSVHVASKEASCFCINGAIAAAALAVIDGGQPLYMGNERQMDSFGRPFLALWVSRFVNFVREGRVMVNPLYSFNDDRDRTQLQVVATLKEARKAALDLKRPFDGSRPQ